jgi:hypothetical protein
VSAIYLLAGKNSPWQKQWHLMNNSSESWEGSSADHEISLALYECG